MAGNQEKQYAFTDTTPVRNRENPEKPNERGNMGAESSYSRGEEEESRRRLREQMAKEAEIRLIEQHHRGRPDAQAQAIAHYRIINKERESRGAVLDRAPPKREELLFAAEASPARTSYSERASVSTAWVEPRTEGWEASRQAYHLGRSPSLREETLPHDAESSGAPKHLEEEDQKRLAQTLEFALETVAQAQLCLQNAHQEVRTALYEFTSLDGEISGVLSRFGIDESEGDERGVEL